VTVATPVMSDHAITLLEKKEHLIVPIVSAQGPSMMENDGLARTPIPVEDLRAVFGCDRIHRHGSFFFY
jgi:hypothetical protein